MTGVAELIEGMAREVYRHGVAAMTSAVYLYTLQSVQAPYSGHVFSSKSRPYLKTSERIG